MFSKDIEWNRYGDFTGVDTAIGGGSVTAHRHDGLFNDFRIKFLHVPTGLSTDFAAILSDFADRHDSSWDEQEYYGRMDPVAKFKNTKRTINFSFSVISDDPNEAATNMARYQKLVKMLYPVYNRKNDQAVNPFQSSDASTIASPPLIGIKFANLIQQVSPIPHAHLVGYVDGFEFKPDNDASYWYANGIDNTKWEEDLFAREDAFGNQVASPSAEKPTAGVDGPIVLPRKFDVSVTFHVLHTHPMGFNQDKEWATDGGGSADYPYVTDQLVDSFPSHLKEKVEIEYNFGYDAAVVPPSVKKNGWDAIMGALFGPPKI